MLAGLMHTFPRHLALVLLVVFVVSCASRPADPEAARRARDLVAAEEAFARDPQDEMAAVWLGRRLGYVGRHEDAIEAFTRGLEAHPDSPWLLRFRGHRFITLRRFDDAARDLERARVLAALRPDEVEPDGAPNKAGIPIGTLRSNIDYHLGLAHYLRGDFAGAWRVYEEGFPLARSNDDRLVSHTYWSWLTLRKLGKRDQAAQLLTDIQRDMRIHENESYLALLRLFSGATSESELLASPTSGKNDASTRGYGIAMKRLCDGDTNGARELLQSVVANGPSASFGSIAAEVELARSFAAPAK